MRNATSYGDVQALIGDKAYVVRMGLLEFARLEEEFGVAGVAACLVAVNKTLGAAMKLYAAALAHHQPELTLADVANLYDFKQDGESVLAEAVADAVKVAWPKLFADEVESDPKTQPATTSPSPESSTS